MTGLCIKRLLNVYSFMLSMSNNRYSPVDCIPSCDPPRYPNSAISMAFDALQHPTSRQTSESSIRRISLLEPRSTVPRTRTNRMQAWRSVKSDVSDDITIWRHIKNEPLRCPPWDFSLFKPASRSGELAEISIGIFHLLDISTESIQNDSAPIPGRSQTI